MSDRKIPWKRIFSVGGVLSLLGAVSALLIGGAYAATSPAIAAQQEAAQKAAFSEIYPDYKDLSDVILISDRQYVKKAWVAFDGEGLSLGHVYAADGKNKYGQIALLIGIGGTPQAPLLGRVAVVQDTESFKTRLESGYVAPYNLKPSEETLVDVRCGATHGAELIRDMVKEAEATFVALPLGG